MTIDYFIETPRDFQEQNQFLFIKSLTIIWQFKIIVHNKVNI